MLTACSVKRNALLNRNYQGMVTCYNLLFNAEVRLEKGEAGLRRAYHPDYNALLKLFPY